MAPPQVFTIPSGIPFARTLSLGVMARCGVAGGGGDPLSLADALVMVPTRRAVRAFRDAFAELSRGAALLPRIVPLGDVGDEWGEPGWPEELEAAAPIAPLRRALLLATLVQRWGEAKHAPIPFTQALAYAGELASFLDEAVTRNADLAKLATLAPDDLAAHWRDVTAFLSIIAVQWPKLLEAEGAIEPAAHRDARLRALARRLRAAPPRSPVIAAGSTGSIPATAELLKTIASLPTGAVVLPGLDGDLDAASWETLDAGHAQFGLSQLLAHIGVSREDVQLWSPLPASYPARAKRVYFLSQALRPPPTTDAWRDFVEGRKGDPAPALDKFALVEARDPREEALVIALALREALETEGRVAALVTPDRGLARRVASELTRWDIAIDDSAGEKLSRTPAGAFLALLARAAAAHFSPIPLLALLKHPLAAGGDDRAQFRRRVRALELAVLRGLRPAAGLAGIAQRLATAKADFGLQHWFGRLCSLLEPFAQMMEAKEASLSELAHAHAQAAEALGASDLWRGTSGESAAECIGELCHEGGDIAIAPAHHYAEVFREIAGLRAVRPRYNLHPRLAILGPLEARLLDFDLVVVSGLNEGKWPAEAATDPWLSRPMRARLGLEPPERRIGLAAHDFSALAASRAVLLTRSIKENGAPATASRWLLRIKQLAKGLGLETQLDSRKDLLEWARELDGGERERRLLRPAPRPPATVRPRRLSVTEIETWLRDPYAIYAKHVLHLKALKPVDYEAGPPERGIAIHAALERFLKTYPETLPPDALEQLLHFGGQAFADAGASAPVLALWMPRFERAARWFVAYEGERRRGIVKSCVEVKGELQIPAGDGFTLRGRVDRIDFFADGASLVDYKSGRVPTDKQINALLSPQLPLEGAMLLKGAFGDLRADSLRDFVHIQLKGGEPPGRECIANVDAQAKSLDALERLTKLVLRYQNPLQPYRSREIPFKLGDKSDYDHLARVREWSLEDETEE